NPARASQLPMETMLRAVSKDDAAGQMNVGGVDVRWTPRLRPEKLCRLYETDARGILDEDLVDEVAYALYSRCESIIKVTSPSGARPNARAAGSSFCQTRGNSSAPGLD